MEKEPSDIWMAISKASTTGFTILCAIAICMGLGYALDYYIGTHPWGLLLGGVIGGFMGLYGVIRQYM